MTTVTLEIAETKHIAELIKLEGQCFETDRISAVQLRRLIKSPSALIVIAKQSDTIVGNAILLFRKNSRLARLYSLATHPDYQSQGVAQRLCEYFQQLAIKLQCTEIRLEVDIHNSRAIHFYHKNGYVEFGRYQNFYENGNDAIRMRKMLTQ